MNDEQAQVAKAYIAQLDAAHVFPAPIVTTIEPGKTFYRAEDYHQDFLAQESGLPYIVYNDLPKVANLKRLFPALYRADPVLVAAGVLRGKTSVVIASEAKQSSNSSSALRSLDRRVASLLAMTRAIQSRPRSAIAYPFPSSGARSARSG